MKTRFSDDPIAKAAYLEALDKYLVPKMQELNRKLAIEAMSRESQVTESPDAATASTKREPTGRPKANEATLSQTAGGRSTSAKSSVAAGAATAAAESLALLPPHNPVQPPTALVRELIDFYRSSRLLERLETFLLAVLSFDELDSDWLLGLCRKFALHDALLYIYNSARLDYIGPFRELLGNLEVALAAQQISGGPPVLSSQQAALRSSPSATPRGPKQTDALNESISSTASSASSASIKLMFIL